MTERKPVVVISEWDSDRFEDACALLLTDGYVMSSSRSHYEFEGDAEHYQAVLIDQLTDGATK